MAAAKLKTKLRPVMIFLLLLSLISSSDATDPILSWCSTNNNYTTNSTFAANLKTLLTSIASNTSIDNFGTVIVGSGKDAVYSLVQCRGDIPADSCRACLADMASQIMKSCPAQKTATVLFDDIVGNRSAPGCLVHYENSNFFGTADSVNQSFYTGSDLTVFFNNATFNRVLAKLLQELTATATADTVIKNYAVGVTPLDNIQNMNGMVQCTQDLSATTCSGCLNAEFENIPVRLKNKIGGRAYTPSCSFRYELYKFYRVTTSPSPTPSPSSSLAPAGNATISARTPPAGSTIENNRRRTTVIIIAVFASAVCLIFTLLIFFLCWKKMISKSTDYEMQDLEDIEALCFKLNTIKTATDNFSDNNKLGEGGYGPVYKGILKDGQEIAVKRMSSHSGQGMIEFKNEVQLIAKLQHRNLVRLLGCCVEGGEKILVYEFLLNTSLDKFLFDPAKNIELDWDTRYKIIVGAARGILYLHEESRLKIIHRDLKASNVLLDTDMNPKIADFGMAKLVHLDETQGNTSRIAGTFGYMSPEYVMQGKFSVKSDVFSFGVVVLEIISGQKNTSSLFQSSGAVDMLVHTWRLWRSGRALELLDETLSESAPRSEVLRCIHIGLLCVQEIPEDRPHMSSVMVMLSSETVTLPSPSPPAFFSATPRPILEDNSTNQTFSETSDYSKSGSEHWSANNGAFSHSEPR